jgi:hypothetical protein
MSTGKRSTPSYNMHTGYREGQGSVKLSKPWKTIVSQELGRRLPLPNYVTIGGPNCGSGFIRRRPLIIGDPNRGVEVSASVLRPVR